MKIGVAVASAILMAAAAGAQSGPPPDGNLAALNRESFDKQGSRQQRQGIPVDQDTRDSVKLYSDLISYGRCTAKVSRKRVRAAMDAVAASPTETALFRDIVAQGQACRGTFYPVMALDRGALAEGLYHDGGEGPSYGPLQPSDPGYKAFLTREAARNVNLDGNDQVVTAAAACLVAQQPQLADAVLETKHGSPQEAQAMDLLFASAPTCAGPKRQANLSRAYLRAFIANAAYRFQQFRTVAKS